MGNLPLQQQWIYDWLTSDINGYVVFIVTVIAGTIHPVMFFLHLYRRLISPTSVSSVGSPRLRAGSNPSTRSEPSKSFVFSNPASSSRGRARSGSNPTKNNQQEQSLRPLKWLVHITTLTAIAFGWIATIFTLVNYLEVVSNPGTCLPLTIAQNITWIFTKLCIYHVLILRLVIAFHGSVHQYNAYMMGAAYAFVTVVSLICIVGSFGHVRSIHFSTGWCLFIIPTWIVLLPVALDVVSYAFILYLFMKPLKKLLSSINLRNVNKSNLHKSKLALSVSQLITKLILLSTIAMISNVCSGLFFAVTDIALGSFIDTLLNPVCLVLMDIAHQDLYKVLCKCCHIGVHRVVHHCNPEISSRPFATVTMPRTASNSSHQSAPETEHKSAVRKASEDTVVYDRDQKEQSQMTELYDIEHERTEIRETVIHDPVPPTPLMRVLTASELHCIPDDHATSTTDIPDIISPGSVTRDHDPELPDREESPAVTIEMPALRYIQKSASVVLSSAIPETEVVTPNINVVRAVTHAVCTDDGHP